MATLIEIFAEPVIQMGFAGFSVILLAILFWVVRRLVCVLEQTNQVITQNTETIRNMLALTDDVYAEIRSLHDKLISRPCISKREQEG